MTVTPESAGHWVAHAAQLALEEPRGPVHLDLPADVAGAAAVPVATALTPPPVPTPADALVDRAAEMIRQAKRPLVMAGLGCRAADAKWLRAFCEALPAPVLTTYKAKGAIPDPHPLAMGIFTGGALEEPLVGRADLIITFGLDTVELIPRRWSYTAPVLSLARGPSSDPRRRAGRRRLLHARARGGRRSGHDPRGAGAAPHAGTSRRTGTWSRWTASAASAQRPSRCRCRGSRRTGWSRSRAS